jgi:sucrose-6-phosphate hydrolase SacC (GH32 family)
MSLFDINGPQNTEVAIYSSEDLTTWNLLAKIKLDDSGKGKYVDPTTINSDHRNYKAVLVQ